MVSSELCDFAAKPVQSITSPEARMRTARPAALLLLCVLGFSVCLNGFGQPKPAAQGGVQAQLNRAADAILALKSTRFSVKREGPPAMLDEKNGITFIARGLYLCRAGPRVVQRQGVAEERHGPAIDARLGAGGHVPVESPDPAIRQGSRRTRRSTACCCSPRPAFPTSCGPSVQKPQVVGKERIQNRDTLHLKGEVSGAKLVPFISSVKPDAHVSGRSLDRRSEPASRCRSTWPSRTATDG